MSVPASPCPTCGKILDGHAIIKGEGTPAPGDATVCAYCGAILIFDLMLRLPNAEEAAEIFGTWDRQFLDRSH